MHKHGYAAGAPLGTAAAELPHAIPGDAGQPTVTSEMGFHNDDDVGVPMGGQEGSDFAVEAAAAVPQKNSEAPGPSLAPAPSGAGGAGGCGDGAGGRCRVCRRSRGLRAAAVCCRRGRLCVGGADAVTSQGLGCRGKGGLLARAR